MKFMDAFELPSDVAGYLIWPTGTLRINSSFEEWNGHLQRERAGVGIDRKTAELLQTITHESYHFLQICTAGYLYAFACRLFVELRRLIPFPLDERKLEAFFSAPPSPSPSWRNLAQSLDSTNADGISIRSLVESAAYLYEHRTHYEGLDHGTYAHIIAQKSVEPEYKVAYNAAVKVLGGDAAFRSFLLASFVSLCFEEPHHVFGDVLQLMARRRFVYRSIESISEFLAAMPELASRHRGLGSAAEVAFERAQELRLSQHPAYTGAIVSLNENAEDSNPIALVVDPDAMTLSAALRGVQPTMFNNGHMWIPTAFSPSGGSDAEMHTKAMTLFSAMALKMSRSNIGTSRFRRF